MRTLVAGIGYAYQSDLAAGLWVIQTLQQRLGDHAGVEILDLSLDPIAAFQRIRDARYERIIFVTAIKRGRAGGSLSVSRPDGPLPPEEVQARIGELAMGAIHLGHLLAMCRYYHTLPEDVTVIEVEPVWETWGEAFSPEAQGAMVEALRLIENELRRAN